MRACLSVPGLADLGMRADAGDLVSAWLREAVVRFFWFKLF